MENKEDLTYEITSKYKHQIDIWYRAYNISREKIELFYDVLSSLNKLVEETYLGTDVLDRESDQMNHFMWCWDKTIENLSKEKIYLKERGEHHDYFWNFFHEAFYLVKMEEGTPRVDDFIYKLFDFRHRKTRTELDVVTEIYKLLDKNLKK